MPEQVTYTLTRITEGISGEAVVDALNTPIIETEQALNALSSKISNLNNKSAVIRHYVPVDTDVTPGTLVYYDTESGKFKPAIAELLSTPGAQGESIESPKSRVEGLVLSIDSSGLLASMLCGGYYESTGVAEACLGAAAKPGTYYLSPYTAGKATTETNGHLRQAVLSYYGDGKLNLNVFYMAHDNHFHASAVLGDTWIPVSGITDVEVPASAAFMYDSTNDTQFKSFGEMSAQTTAVFASGILQAVDGSVFIENNRIWYKGQAVPVSGTVTVFNHFPFAYNSPVIRAVESGSDALTITNTNGRVSIKALDFVNAGSTAAGSAVSDIQGRNIKYTPVISDIIAGPGVSISKSGDGKATVASSGIIGTPLDAYSINHNGTQVTSDGIFTYVVFPRGRNSELVMSLPVNSVGESAVTAVVWVQGLPGVSLDVAMTFIPARDAEKPTTMTNVPGLSLQGQENSFVCSETSSGISVAEQGLLIAKLKTSSTEPASDMRLLRLGFKLNIAE